MAKRIGIFVDVSNLYYCVRNKYGKRKLDYRKLYDYIKDLGDITVANAYGAQMDSEAKPFISALRAIGYLPKYKQLKVYDNNDQGRRFKANWDVGICIDIVTTLVNLDVIVLCSADGDFKPVVDYVMSQGKSVVIIASSISKDLRDNCTQAIEIPESLVEDSE